MYNGFIISSNGGHVLFPEYLFSSVCPAIEQLERAIIVTLNSEYKPVAIQNDDDTAIMKDIDQKNEETVEQFPHALDRIGYHYIYFHVLSIYLIAL